MDGLVGLLHYYYASLDQTPFCLLFSWLPLGLPVVGYRQVGRFSSLRVALCLCLGCATSVGVVEMFDCVGVGSFDGSISASGLRALFVHLCWLCDVIGSVRRLFNPLGKSMSSHFSLSYWPLLCCLWAALPFWYLMSAVFGYTFPWRGQHKASSTAAPLGKGLWLAAVAELQ